MMYGTLIFHITDVDVKVARLSPLSVSDFRLFFFSLRFVGYMPCMTMSFVW